MKIHDCLKGYFEIYKTFCVVSILQKKAPDNLGKPHENKGRFLASFYEFLEKGRRKTASKTA